ncbi:hypothetical protein CLF_112850 [Clonorchis sinensis]|uniref:Uncharacterized protein n=1 Tax=Clonorchis sinensis TaxID=79923 RepID=H2KTA4_CLOSI|nr:hypothetical protein CLF_112850 [Clonorchis sinensis]
MTHRKTTTFLSILLFILFVGAEEDTLEKEGLVEKIVGALSETKVDVLAHYKQDLFKPLTGPFFKPVWELGSPYNVFGTIGFPQINDTGSELISPRLVQNKSIAFYDEICRQYLLAFTCNFSTIILKRTDVLVVKICQFTVVYRSVADPIKILLLKVFGERLKLGTSNKAHSPPGNQEVSFALEAVRLPHILPTHHMLH